MLDRIKALPDRIKAAIERRPRLALLYSIQTRFSAVHGGYLAAAVTLTAFLSLFPLLLVGIAVLGFFSARTVDLPGQVIDALSLSANDQAAELIRDAIQSAEENKATASIVGVAGLLWSGLGLVAALSYAYDSAWQVKGRGIKDKAFGLLWLIGALVVFGASFGATAVLNFLPALFAPLSILVGVAVSFGLFLWTAKVLGNREVGWRALIPGALFGAVGFEILKLVGSVYLPRLVASSEVYGKTIGVVFALIAWLFFFGRLVVYSAVLNVVLWERRHGTVTVEVEVPKLPNMVPIDATRAGKVDDRIEIEPPTDPSANEHQHPGPNGDDTAGDEPDNADGAPRVRATRQPTTT